MYWKIQEFGVKFFLRYAFQLPRGLYIQSTESLIPLFILNLPRICTGGGDGRLQCVVT